MSESRIRADVAEYNLLATARLRGCPGFLRDLAETVPKPGLGVGGLIGGGEDVLGLSRRNESLASINVIQI